jgi:hypothetical protein
MTPPASTDSHQSDPADFLEKVVLAEIEGKNAAIHAYDGMIWKIRTGLLTLLFVGWSVLLKSFTDNLLRPAESYRTIIMAMFLFSLGLSLGAWFVDHAYVRRRFRVILALNELMTNLSGSAFNIKALTPDALHVAGDNPSRPHRCKGYSEAMQDGACVFFVPILTLAIAAGVLLRSNAAVKENKLASSPAGISSSTNAGNYIEGERKPALSPHASP